MIKFFTKSKMYTSELMEHIGDYLSNIIHLQVMDMAKGQNQGKCGIKRCFNFVKQHKVPIYLLNITLWNLSTKIRQYSAEKEWGYCTQMRRYEIDIYSIVNKTLTEVYK